MDFITITEAEEGQRLDTILAKRFDQVKSRTYFQYLIEEGFVLLNGNSVKKRDRPKVGDEIEIDFQLTPELTLAPEPIPLEVIFEDEYLIVVNKPAGMVVHPAVGHWQGTFVNALLYHCQGQFSDLTKPDLSDSSSLRPGIVHRLDKDTTGLLIAAKDSYTQQRLTNMFASKQIHKVYAAICVGKLNLTEIRLPIGRHPKQRKLMAVRESGGKEALTFCHTKAFNGQLSLVDVVLATGRTHQIRVHFAYYGNPILGDATYGNLPINRRYAAMIDRQMLHAQALRFNHPVTGKLLELTAPLPEDMNRLIQFNKLFHSN
jgi:23S rRNA pseudouridine1911/1915/1917 synthase